MKRSYQTITFHKVSFGYESMSAPLFQGLSLRFSAEWTGVVGANGLGKTTLLKLAAGILKPQAGTVQRPSRLLYCPQRTDDPPEELEALLEATNREACRVKGRLSLEADWCARWGTLSHGERKRAQIGVALWKQPEGLALDEPTNHLDIEARDMVAGALALYTGVGMLVSHDRKLLDELCTYCLFISPQDVVLRPGGVTKGMLLAREEQVRRERELSEAKRALSNIKRDVVRRRGLASQQQKRRSKRGLDPKDHDARFKKNLARYTGKDGTGGKLLRQLDGRVRRANERFGRVERIKVREIEIRMPGSRSQRDTLFRFSATTLPLGGSRGLTVPDLSMRPVDRIAMTGPNGSGKSTLIRRIVSGLGLPQEDFVYIPQEIDLQAAGKIMERARRLDRIDLGRLMATVGRLGSMPGRLLESTEPSPGEIRKMLLALGMVHDPCLIIMDEPTNHMDLPSIEALERALSECPSALLLVSHDERFLSALTKTRWRIIAPASESLQFRLRRD
jgi:ATPase subunit of ABC transporter with duplicated ATPase domains